MVSVGMLACTGVTNGSTIGSPAGKGGTKTFCLDAVLLWVAIRWRIAGGIWWVYVCMAWWLMGVMGGCLAN